MRCKDLFEFVRDGARTPTRQALSFNAVICPAVFISNIVFASKEKQLQDALNMIHMREALLQFQLSAQWFNKGRCLEILSDFSHWLSLLQRMAIRLQISGTVFKNQLSVTETMFF